MKEELINKAFELGFKTNNGLDLFNSDKPNDYYIWLCLLQKWLREEHKIDVLPDRMFAPPFPYGYRTKSEIGGERIGLGIPNKFETYKEALEKGLQAALKLIESI